MTTHKELLTWQENERNRKYVAMIRDKKDEENLAWREKEKEKKYTHIVIVDGVEFKETSKYSAELLYNTAIELGETAEIREII